MPRRLRRDPPSLGGLCAPARGLELHAFTLCELGHALAPGGARLRRDANHTVDVQLLRPEAFSFQAWYFVGDMFSTWQNSSRVNERFGSNSIVHLQLAPETNKKAAGA